jgi:Siphovirus ReqiPepy6 Gp37-like protein
MLDKYFVYVRDKDLKIKEVIDSYKQLTFVMRYNRLGSWQVELDFNSAAAQAFLSAFSAESGGTALNKGRSGILIYRNGSLIFSGPIRNLRERWSRKEGHRLTIGGPCDLTFLAERMIVVPPYAYQVSYGSDFFYATSASTEYCIKQVVITQAGASAATQRQITGLGILTNQDRGYNPTSLRARFTNALDEIQKAAQASENRGFPLGFYLRQNGTSGLDFDCYTPVDKTSKVIFSPEIGNLLEYEYSLSAPSANLVMAGDDKTGTARNFAFAGDEPSRALWGTIENFVDAGTATTAELTDKVYESLEDGAEQNGLRFRLLEIPGFAFQTDWNLGDKVRFRLRGKDTSEIIREVEVSLGPDGETITPTIGNMLGPRLRAFDRVKKMEYRLKNRENY